MVNVRQLVESDLKTTLEAEFFLPVFLTDATTGIKYTLNTDGDPLGGQVLNDSIKINPQTGEEELVKNPVVTLRRSTLIKVPIAGEVWSVEIPISPDPLADKKLYTIGAMRASDDGESIGYIRLYLEEAVQQ